MDKPKFENGKLVLKGKSLSSAQTSIKIGKVVTRDKALELGQAIMPKVRKNFNERIASEKSMKDEYIG